MEKQLVSVTRNFIADTSKNSITPNKIEVSKIFDWFAADFKTKGDIIDFLNFYSTIKISSNAKISYKYYNWNLND